MNLTGGSDQSRMEDPEILYMKSFLRYFFVFLLLLTPLLADKHKEPMTDDRIHDQVLMKLAGDPDVRGGGFDVDVHNGVVTLKGRVEFQKQKDKASHLVKKVKGVQSVDNQLQVGPK